MSDPMRNYSSKTKMRPIEIIHFSRVLRWLLCITTCDSNQHNTQKCKSNSLTNKIIKASFYIQFSNPTNFELSSVWKVNKHRSSKIWRCVEWNCVYLLRLRLLRLLIIQKVTCAQHSLVSWFFLGSVLILAPHSF